VLRNILVKIQRILFVLLAALSPSIAIAQNPAVVFDLQEYLQQVRTEFPKLKIGVQVTIVDDGRNVFAEAADEQLIPASVLKLATTYAALKYLGSDYRFPTEVFLDHLPKELGQKDEKRVDFSTPETSVGNLYVRGYGDPLMDTVRLHALADMLPRYGIKELQDVIIDDTLFQDPPRASGDKPHQAGQSAVSLNFNAYSVYLAPAAIGQSAFVSHTDGIPFEILNRVKTVRGDAFTIDIIQSPSATGSVAGTDTKGRVFFSEPRRYVLSVQGVMGFDASAQSLLESVADIPEYFAFLLKHSIARAGVVINGKFRRSEIPQSAKLLQTIESEPLSEIVAKQNHFSNNMIAGQLVFAMGQETTGFFDFEHGLDRIRSVFVQLGELTDSFHLVDGSGLSRENRVKASQLIKIIRAAASDFSIGPDFIASLSRFGQIGTLKTREILDPKYFATLWGEEREEARRRANSVWAKTGTLDGVSSLCGLLELKTGERAAFAILLNNIEQKDQAIKIENDIVKTLVGFPREFNPAPIVPKQALPPPPQKPEAMPAPAEELPAEPLPAGDEALRESPKTQP